VKLFKPSFGFIYRVYTGTASLSKHQLSLHIIQIHLFAAFISTSGKKTCALQATLGVVVVVSFMQHRRKTPTWFQRFSFYFSFFLLSSKQKKQQQQQQLPLLL